MPATPDGPPIYYNDDDGHQSSDVNLDDLAANNPTWHPNTSQPHPLGMDVEALEQAGQSDDENDN